MKEGGRKEKKSKKCVKMKNGSDKGYVCWYAG